jgi:hypothetical protein
MFEDYIDKDYELSDFEKWYDENYMFFEREFNKQLGPTLDISLFYTGVYCPVMQELSHFVRKLMVRQFPVIDLEFRPLVLKYIDWVVSMAGHRFLMNLYQLIHNQKEGINLREKYPDFESWISFYARPSQPDLITEVNYEKFTLYTDQEKKDLIDDENKDITDFFEKEQLLKKEYYDMIQPLVFKYYPALQDLDYDGWIIYSVQIREDYEDYKFRCEHIETFIEYEFQEEDINLRYDEFQAKFRIKYNEKWEREHPFAENRKRNNSHTQTDL